MSLILGRITENDNNNVKMWTYFKNVATWFGSPMFGIHWPCLLSVIIIIIKQSTMWQAPFEEHYLYYLFILHNPIMFIPLLSAFLYEKTEVQSHLISFHSPVASNLCEWRVCTLNHFSKTPAGIRITLWVFFKTQSARPQPQSFWLTRSWVGVENLNF